MEGPVADARPSASLFRSRRSSWCATLDAPASARCPGTPRPDYLPILAPVRHPGRRARSARVRAARPLRAARPAAAGDVRVEGSRHYQAFDTTLIPRPSFERLKAERRLPIAVKPVCADHIADRRQMLETELSTVAALARTDAAGRHPGWGRAKNLAAACHHAAEAEALREVAYELLPRVRISDLLIEVDAWTGFSECFTHQRSGRPSEDRPALLAAILADGINLGLNLMAESCRGVTLRQLAWRTTGTSAKRATRLRWHD